MNNKTWVKVDDYYQDDLFKFVPEPMFEILDEAYYYKRPYCWIPDYMIDEFNSNKR